MPVSEIGSSSQKHVSPIANEFDSRMFAAINDMLLDMLAPLHGAIMSSGANVSKRA